MSGAHYRQSSSRYTTTLTAGPSSETSFIRQLDASSFHLRPPSPAHLSLTSLRPLLPDCPEHHDTSAYSNALAAQSDVPYSRLHSWPVPVSALESFRWKSGLAACQPMIEGIHAQIAQIEGTSHLHASPHFRTHDHSLSIRHSYELSSTRYNVPSCVFRN